MQGEITGGTQKYISRKAVISLLWQLIPAAAGFIMSRVKILYALTPLGTAVVAAAPGGSVVSALIGAIAGAMIPGGADDALRAVATLIAAAGIRWALSELYSVSSSVLFIPGTAFFATLLTGLTVSISAGRGIGYQTALYAAEGLIAAAGAYFFAGTVRFCRSLDLSDIKKNAPSRADITSIAASGLIILIPLCRIRIAGFSPVAALMMMAVLIAARLGGAAYGAVAGISAGAVFLLSGGDAVHCSAVAAAGLAAALFMPAGSIAAAIAFVSVCSIGALSSGALNIFFIAQALLAAAAFCLIPARLTDRLYRALPVENAADRQRSASAPPSDIAARLVCAAEGLMDVSRSVSKASRHFDRLDKPDPDNIYREAVSRICSRCSLNYHCWGDKADDTRSQLEGLTPILRQGGSIRSELSVRCAHWEELSSEINSLYLDFAVREGAIRRLDQVRSVMAGQLCSVGDMLCELAESAGERIDDDPALRIAISQALRDAGYPPSQVRCTRGSSGQLSISADIIDIEEDAADADELAVTVGDALGIGIIAPSLPEIRRRFTLELRQRPPLEIEFGAAQHCRPGERLCGDAYEAFDDDDTCAVMLISDGMGSGGRAAALAAMTSGLLCRLLKAGFGAESAMRLVNSSLQLKSDDESLATADCARVDLFTGEAQFCKAGAVQSFVRQGGKVTRIDIPSLPLGIMDEPDCGSVRITLHPGDIVVMVSDGAITGDDGWIEQALLVDERGDMKALARLIVSQAARLTGGDDDITALVWRIVS